MTRKGLNFERAVHAFVANFAQGAKVVFDHRVLDRDTGRERQVDVWVEAKIAGHFPVSILISCKDYGRKVNVQQMGAFINEVQSTGASTGVIYARNGFSEAAVEKARAYGMSCCRLYENEPADMPMVLTFQQFVSKPQFQHQVTYVRNVPSILTWGELYDLALRTDGTVMNALDEALRDLQNNWLETLVVRRLPQGARRSLVLALNDDGIVHIDVILKYAHYRGRIEAQLIAGSYCVTDGSFLGSQTGPVIDTWSLHPGPGWEAVEPDTPVPANAVILVFGGGTPVEEQAKAQRAKPLHLNELTKDQNS